jgi:hypothetical protein
MSVGPHGSYGYVQQQPPPPICPHCGAQGFPGAQRCHSCGKSYSTSSSLWWILGICTALVLALVVGLGLACGSIIGGAGDLAQEGIDASFEELERVQEQSSITQAEFVTLRPGASRAAVEARLGRPADVSTTGPSKVPREPAGASCIYYFERGQSLFLGPTYRVCFARGRLTEKDVIEG